MPLGSVYSASRRATKTGPVCSYAKLRQSLPDPPNGEHWVRDASTGDWRIEDDGAVIERSFEGADKLVVGTAEASNDDHYEYIEHVIQPHDTFQGLCLRYKLTPRQLRQAGKFSGDNLKLASNPLRIRVGRESRDVQVQNVTKEEKITSIRMACPRLAMTEAKCYLDLNDWDVKAAVENAREDGF